MSFLFAPAAGAAMLPPSADGESPAEVQRKTLRPERANTLTQFECPVGSVQKRSRPLGANTLTLFACPGQPVQRKEPPVRANTLTQFACPGFPVQKKGKSRKNFPARKGSKNARSHAEKTSIRTVWLAKPNRPEFSRKFLSKKCLTYWLGYANLYTWLAEAY